MRRSRSLRTRLLQALMLMTLLTLSIASGLSALMDLKLFRDHLLRDLRVLAAVVGENCVAALVFDSPESARQNLATLASEYQIRTATLYDAQGQPFADWQASPSLPRPTLTAPVEIAYPLHFDRRAIGRLVLVVRLDELERQARSYATLALLLALVTLTIALVVALRLQRRIARPILELVEATRMVARRQDFSLRVPSPQAEREIDTLVESFNRMLAQIEQREAALERANVKLRQLATDLSLLEETEKARLASELHDGPMQKLALAQMQIDASAEVGVDAQTRAEAGEQLAAGLALMREAIAELRTLQFELSPPVLHRRGLAAALDWLAGDTRERWGIDMTCVVAANLPVLNREQSVILFQCARELVHNLIKHAQARHAQLALTVDSGELALSVADDGRGFALRPDDGARTVAEGGYGLYSIRERLRLLGGRLEVDSPATGSRLIIRLPLVVQDSDRPSDEVYNRESAWIDL